MSTSPEPPQICTAKTREQSESVSIYSFSGEAFEHIHRHQTPPDPITYSLWYAYASKSPSIVRAEIDALLSRRGVLSPYDINEIYQAHLSDNSPDAANECIGRKFENNLSAVTELLERGVDQNADFKATLDDVGGALQEVLSSCELQSILTKLMAESQSMAQVSKDLSEGLQESRKQVRRLNSELERVRNQSLRDPLTEIANRRAFDSRIASEIQQAENGSSGFCLVLSDIDNFKYVNDTYGHQTGDDVLKMFAEILMENTKGQDLVARFGGDEFAIILPGTDIMAAYNLMVDIKYKFEAINIATGNSHQQTASVSASFGISSYTPPRSASDMIERADANLYQSKISGRNRVNAEGLG